MNAERTQATPWYLISIMLIACLEFFQNGLLNFASSQVMGGVGAAPEEFSYAAMAYASAAVLVLLQHEWLSRRLGMRRYIRLSIIVFGVGALTCGFANGPSQLILGRALQGLGGAAFFTAARVEVNALTDKSKMLGLLCFGYALMLGSACGPLLGAELISRQDWRWIFFAVLPALALAWPATRLLSQRAEPAHPHTQGSRAFLCMIVGVLALQWLIQQLPYDFFSRPEWLLAILALALLAGWGWQYHRRRRPLRKKALLQLRYLAGLGFYSCCYLLVSANSYILPVMAQQALGFDLPTTGRLLSVSFVAGILFSTLYAFLLLKRRARGVRAMMAAACCLLLLYGVLMSGLNQNAPASLIVSILICNGGFMSLFIMAVAQATFSHIDQPDFARAYQTKNIVRQLSLSMGVAASTVFLQARNALHYQRLSEGFSVLNPAFNAALDQLQQALPELSAKQRMAVLAGQLTQQSQLLSCLDFFRLECVMAIGLIVIVLWQQSLGRQDPGPAASKPL